MNVGNGLDRSAYTVTAGSIVTSGTLKSVPYKVYFIFLHFILTTAIIFSFRRDVGKAAPTNVVFALSVL